MGLELDEILYKKAINFLKKRKEKNADTLRRKVCLQEVKPRLTLLARAVCGASIEIFPAEQEGGYKDNNFFLPAECTLFSEKQTNELFFLFRTIYLSMQRELQLNWTEPSADEAASGERAIETAPKVLSRLFESFPGLLPIYDQLLLELPRHPKTGKREVKWLYGKWMKNSSELNGQNILEHTDGTPRQLQEKLDASTTLQVKAVEEIESLTIDKKQQEDYVLMHSFEKIEAAEPFNGNWRDFDGKDELEDHQAALEEMGMRHTVRVDTPVHSIYQADFVENTRVAESASVEDKGFHLCYDEWDYRKRCYLKDYCKVYPQMQLRADAAYYQSTCSQYKVTLNGLRKMLTSVNNKMMQQRKQIQGDAFDLDALTDLYADLHSGVSPDERVYLAKRKKEKDLSLLLLLDASLSSDGYVAGNRVLDVEKEVSILFGEILDEFSIEFAIDGFYSRTRNHTTYITLKDFGESWSKAKHKVGALEPGGYTRIGPALRHAGARLLQSGARNKWIILLSDGKPNDYDKYEGQRGIQDIKQALRELNEQNINSYALAIEAQAKYYLPEMFGQNHYQILSSPQSLLQSLARLYEKIKHQ